jgi:hypothetical protein
MGVILGVAGNAIPGCALIDTVTMTGCALNFRMAAVQREASSAMIEMDILPGCRLMTISAIRAELSTVRILRGMARITVGGRAFIHSIGMAGRAGDPVVAARQREAGLAVVKVDILPITRVMAIGTILSHLPGVNIVMTRGAICGCVLEECILMAALTGNGGVLAQQLERRRGMIKLYIFPGCCGMARLTVLSQCTLMGIILPMTGETIHGRAFEHVIDVAACTRYVDMCRQEFKDRAVVVKMNCLPIFRDMTGSTIRAESPFMRIILPMTGKTILSG